MLMVAEKSQKKKESDFVTANTKRDILLIRNEKGSFFFLLKNAGRTARVGSRSLNMRREK